jgi:hypothetical protein
VKERIAHPTDSKFLEAARAKRVDFQSKKPGAFSFFW